MYERIVVKGDCVDHEKALFTKFKIPNFRMLQGLAQIIQYLKYIFQKISEFFFDKIGPASGVFS